MVLIFLMANGFDDIYLQVKFRRYKARDALFIKVQSYIMTHQQMNKMPYILAFLQAI